MLIGHQKQRNFLEKTAKSDKLAHAYLFCGQEKLGKKTIAVEFAKWLFKDYNPPTASSHSSLARAQRRVEKLEETSFFSRLAFGSTNECSSSRSEWAPDIIKRQHPDFIFIEPEKKEIQISQIRECIWRLSLKPSVAPFKIAIIDEAHCLNQEAQNSLLKTLEEPRGKTLIFLVTEYPERLFPTIISRCQILKFYSVPKEEIERYLVDELRSSSRRGDRRRNLFLRSSPPFANARVRKQNILESEIKQMVELSEGRPGRALDFMSDPQKLKTQKTVISDLISMSNSDLAFRFQYAKNLVEEDKSSSSPFVNTRVTKELQNLKDTLDIWLRHFRSVLISSINTASQTGYSLNKLRDIIKLIQETNFLISTTNVNPRLALEILMMEL